MRFLRKYHKWISISFSLFILMYAFSGIILNHREFFSYININRNFLPSEYHYNKWNNASVKSTLKINNNQILIYGNIGIWLTDSLFSRFIDFNNGFEKGIDKRKITVVFKTHNNKIIAGSLFGLYQFSFYENKWKKLNIPVNDKQITDIIEVKDTVFILTRSYLLKTNDFKVYKVTMLPAPENYNNKISLFKTLWVIHSGEIYGLFGKIIVDIIALIFAFLTISGFIVFINRLIIKNSKTAFEKKIKKIKLNKWILKWHNKIGWSTLIFLLLTTSSGMFLRPPFLIPIAENKVAKIPYSILDNNNPWFDQLRRILYDQEQKRFLISTSEGLFYSDNHFTSPLKKFKHQPPISVMGLNVFQKKAKNIYLLGSFEGLFLWNAESGYTFDYIDKKVHKTSSNISKPIGKHLISGYTNDFKNNEIYFDYNTGAHSFVENKKMVDMPNYLIKQPISLWNIALEFHTGRIFKFVLGDFYILIVPLTGLAVIFSLTSGFIIWFKYYRK